MAIQIVGSAPSVGCLVGWCLVLQLFVVQHQFVGVGQQRIVLFCRIYEEYEGCISGKNNENL